LFVSYFYQVDPRTLTGSKFQVVSSVLHHDKVKRQHAYTLIAIDTFDLVQWGPQEWKTDPSIYFRGVGYYEKLSV